VNPKVRTQLLTHPVGEQPADVVHVDHIGQHSEIDHGGVQSLY